jgi:hypothetical protein
MDLLGWSLQLLGGKLSGYLLMLPGKSCYPDGTCRKGTVKRLRRRVPKCLRRSGDCKSAKAVRPVSQSYQSSDALSGRPNFGTCQSSDIIALDQRPREPQVVGR